MFGWTKNSFWGCRKMYYQKGGGVLAARVEFVLVLVLVILIREV